MYCTGELQQANHFSFSLWVVRMISNTDFVLVFMALKLLELRRLKLEILLMGSGTRDIKYSRINSWVIL